MNDAALAEWLRLREAADWTSRAERLAHAVVSVLPPDDAVRVVDLATGAGSNFRYLADRLPRRQEWLLVDRSRALLQEGETRTGAWAAAHGRSFTPLPDGFGVRDEDLDCRVRVHRQDLGALTDTSLFAGCHLVTASALLDLVSESWLRTVAAHCRAAGASALFTIVYDGRSSCVPAEPEDAWIRALMNAHQQRDKGLGGVAEGPAAAACALRCFTDAGYRVESAQSDWVLGPSDGGIQRVLIDGWAEAALEMAPTETEAIAAWQARRHGHVAAGRSHITVGHQDLAALPLA